MSNQLKRFNEYCKAHPKERFWQALRNWADADQIFIGKMTNKGGGIRVLLDGMPVYLTDTFQIEDGKVEKDK